MSNGGSRVPIPNSIRKTIQDIKEIASKHSDDDIYGMLKECNMDPNETAQRLLYLDTFQEVKKKRDSRKVNVNSRVSEESRWRTGTQGRGFRGGRGHYSSSHISHGAGGGRNVTALKENGVSNRMERGFNTPLTVPEKTENNTNPRVTISSNISFNGPTSLPNGSPGHDHGPQPSKGVYSSASDPVVVPPLNSWNPGVGAVKHEGSSQMIASDSGASNPAVNRSNTAHNVANDIQATSGDVTSIKTLLQESLIVEKYQPLEPSQPSSMPTSFGSLEVISIQDEQSSEQLIEPSKALAVEASPRPLPELNVSVLEDATPKFDMKLGKLDISVHQTVIFPDHLQVPDDVKNGLIFGSLDLEESANCGNGPDDWKGSFPAPEFHKENDKAAKETSLSNISLSSTTQEGDYWDRPHSPPHVPDNSAHLKDDVSSVAAPKYDHSKQEIMFPQGGPQYPFFHIGPNYGYPLIQPMLGSQLVQYEGPEPQSGNSPVSSTSISTQSATQPAGVGQSSIAVSPPPFPVFRPPYPPNYFPFGPYFPSFYLASNGQLLGHSGLPQQPSTGNIYLSPPAAVPGTKFSVPQGKPGINAGNLTQLGVPSGYNLYSHSPAVTSGNSAGSEDIAASGLKENNGYSTVQQGEGPPLLWVPAPGRDMMHANSFYNHLSPGQHVPFPPPQAAMYHPT